MTKYISHKPTPKQKAFLLLDCREVFYGGAGGGGKSDALLMGALQYVDVPGYAALLLRRTYSDLALPEAIMTRSMEWLSGTDAKWVSQSKEWVFPSGATLTFGYLQSERDKYRYQSAAFQYIGFDELTQFTETQYTYLFSRLRRLEGVAIPIRMRSASNPGNNGHEWVKQRFLIEGKIKRRPFIPAKIEDNPYLDREEYEKSLDELDPVLREQIKHGNWEVIPEGKMFSRGWFEVVEAVPSQLYTVRAWDMAATRPKLGSDPDWTVGVRMGELDGVYYIVHVVRIRETPKETEDLIRSMVNLDGRTTEIHMEQEPGSSGVMAIDHYAREVLNGFTFYGHRSTGSKVMRARPVSSAAERGNIKILRGNWNSDYIDEMTAFPSVGIHDDQVDATSLAFEALAGSAGNIDMDYEEDDYYPAINPTGRPEDESGDYAEDDYYEGESSYE